MSGESDKLGVQCTSSAMPSESAHRGTSCQVDSTAALSLVSPEFSYSSYEPDLVVASHELYLLKPTVRTADERRYRRIPARNIHACIRTEDGTSVIVDLINISRGGVFFRSCAEFDSETLVSIATHYILGGQNIFQEGRIVRVQRKPLATLPGEYAVEYSLNAAAVIA